MRLWDLKRSGECLAYPASPIVLPHESVRFALAFSPDGKRLVCGGLNSLTIWSCSSKDCEPLVRKEGDNLSLPGVFTRWQDDRARLR